MLVIIWKANEIRPLNIERAKQFQVSLIIWARYTECLWRNCLLKTRNFTKNVWLLNFFATEQFRSFRWLIFSLILLSKSWKLLKMIDLISSLNFWVRKSYAIEEKCKQWRQQRFAYFRTFFFTLGPRYKVPLYNKVLDIMNHFRRPSNRKIYGREPRYNETLL